MSDVVDRFVVPGCEDDFEFHFTSHEKRRLHSVAIVNGAPEFRFDPSPNVPALTEEDIAVAFRLALEGKRPEFFYIPIPPTHPLHGSQYKQYKPEWLEGTSIGETLSETDWAMKSLTNGLRSNDSKTEFWAWEKTSQLEGLATSMDFERDKRSGSVIMSCESVSVRKSDSEMEFVGEPRLHINSESSPAYSRYINRVLPSVAYHDEPLFLRFGEIVKLMVAVEWLVEKGVNMSQRWLEEHSRSSASKPKVTIQQLRGEPSPSKPRDALTPLPAVPEGEPRPPQQVEAPQRKDLGDVPSRNVAMKKSEAKHCRKYPKGMAEKSGLLYGYCDPGSGEMVQCDASGTLCARMRSLKVFCERRTCVDGNVVESTQFRMKIPFLEGPNGNEAPGSALPDAQDLMSPAMSSHMEFNEQSGCTTSLQLARTHDDGITMTTVSESNSDSHHHKTVCVARGSLDDYNMLYKGLDPNLPLRPDIPGVCEAIVPNVQSWNELRNKTVPWPQVSLVPLDGKCTGVLTARGGVTARSIPVVEDRKREREGPSRIPEGRVIVRGFQTTRYQGKISRLFGGAVWQQVVHHFQSAWTKSPSSCPTVQAVFAVTNSMLQTKWDTYKSRLGDSYRGMETHFHGTTLACDILNTGRLCDDSQCGVCGISDNGLDPKFIRTNIKYQRFGNGFYLAPHSSKCHDYTYTTNGYRAMLLCDVLPGKKFTARTSVTGPPAGYDSVEGVVDDRTELNYPEILLTKSEAIMPRFIIVY